MEADPVAGSGHPPIGVEQRRGRHSAVAGRLPGPGAPNPQSEVQCKIAIPDAGGEVDAAGHRSDLAVGIDRFDELDEELPSPVHVAVCLALLRPLEEPQGLLSHLPSHGAFPRPGTCGQAAVGTDRASTAGCDAMVRSPSGNMAPLLSARASYRDER
jgi:hypothetical protein